MPYVENRIVHDADTHLMELPDCLDPFIDPKFRDAFIAHTAEKRKRVDKWGGFDEVVARHQESGFRAGAEEALLTRKYYDAMGAFRKDDRVKSLDAFGFRSQLVFTTYALGNFGLEETGDPELAWAAARAHNRMMTDFCSADPRLLATAYIPLLDRERAILMAAESIREGAKALMINSKPPGYSPSHTGLDPLWAMAQEAGLPIIFHVGGEQKMERAYADNGGPLILDFLGGAENFTGLSFMAIPYSVQMTVSALIFDGVFDRFPQLKFGAIELGASWLPSWMRFMDSAHAAFHKETRMQKLSAKPSELVKRQFRVTPYVHEDAGWIIQNSGDEICMFSSDYPHAEGGRNPIKRFDETTAGLTEHQKRRFYADNFVDLMGRGMPDAVRAAA